MVTGPQVYALGQDRYWLEALTRATDSVFSLEAVYCAEGLVNCLGSLPEVDAEALLLLDATHQHDVRALVQGLRGQGWRFVVVVAADPSWKESRDLLHGGLAYDYWKKSYAPAIIQDQIQRCLAEMQKERIR